MKTKTPFLLACLFAVSCFADDVKTNAPAEKPDGKKISASIDLAAGEIKTPLVLTNGILSQPETTDLGTGGQATFSFNLMSEGTYVIKALVDAPGEDANSFYINVDGQPSDPDMVWDIEPTNGFEERTVSWRGNGDASNDEFSPKKFKLTAGAHKLTLVGREPSLLKKLWIVAAE